MPKTFRDVNLSPFVDSDQREVFDDFSSLLEQCNVDDDRCWTCFAWRVTRNTERQRSERTYFGRDELVLMLDSAVQWLRGRGYWWPMIGFVVKSPRKQGKRRGGRWHVHVVEIANRLPSREQRELIREALRRAGFSDVQLDDLTLSSSDLAWWKPREEAKDNGHEGFGRYAAKNAAEHDSETPFAVYRASNVPGPKLPGEDVTREILRAARASAPKTQAPSPRRPVVRAPVQPVPANHQAAQTAQKTIGGLRLPRPLFDPPPTAPKRQPPAPQVIKKSTTWKDLRPKEVRQSFADMLLQSVELRPRTYVDRYGDPGVSNQWLLVFAGRDGHRYQWPSSRDLVVEAPDGRRYPMDTGLRWNFDAALKVPALPARKSRVRNITRAWSPGSPSRKVLLVHQPEPTRRAYAVKYNIPLHELGMEGEE